jgi:HPt (histidine-containing phosphotransfer) domain-containing protein
LPEQLKDLERTLADANLQRLSRVAHGMKSGLSMIAAASAARAAARLESLAGSGDLPACEAAARRLRAELAKLSPCLEDLLKAA